MPQRPSKQNMHIGVKLVESRGEAAVVIYSQDGSCHWAFTDAEAVARLSKSLDEAARALAQLGRGAKKAEIWLPQHQELANHLMKN